MGFPKYKICAICFSSIFINRVFFTDFYKNFPIEKVLKSKKFTDFNHFCFRFLWINCLFFSTKTGFLP